MDNNTEIQGVLAEILKFVREHLVQVILVWILSYLAINRYGYGLSKYPGPFLASITDWWRFYDVYKRRPERTQRRLHDKHGPVVRLGPKTLTFSDPKALKTIYGLNKGFIKVSVLTYNNTPAPIPGLATQQLNLHVV